MRASPARRFFIAQTAQCAASRPATWGSGRMVFPPRFSRAASNFARNTPRLPRARGLQLLVSLQRHGGAPIHVADENEIGGRIIGGAVPFGSADRAWQKWTALLIAKTSLAFSIRVVGVR